MPRLILASFVTFLVAQYSEYFLYSAFSTALKNRFFLLRNYLSVSLSQGLDTLLFALLGLSGMVENLGQIILVSYVIKMITLLSIAPFLALARGYMQTPPNS